MKRFCVFACFALVAVSGCENKSMEQKADEANSAFGTWADNNSSLFTSPPDDAASSADSSADDFVPSASSTESQGAIHMDSVLKNRDAESACKSLFGNDLEKLSNLELNNVDVPYVDYSFGHTVGDSVGKRVVDENVDDVLVCSTRDVSAYVVPDTPAGQEVLSKAGRDFVVGVNESSNIGVAIDHVYAGRDDEAETLAQEVAGRLVH